MFSELHIRGFKCWKDTGPIRLAPLTVFFGTNSSGKTSLCQFLLMLKQTAQSSDRHRVLHLGDANTPVELGTFHDMVFGHDTDGSISFSINCRIPWATVESDNPTRRVRRAEGFRFEAEVGTEPAERDRMIVKRMIYTWPGPDPTNLMVGMKPEADDYRKCELVSEGSRLIRRPGRQSSLPPPVRFYGFPEEVAAYYQNSDVPFDLALALERQLGHLCYVGPLRKYPRRSYIWSGEVPEHVGYHGELAVEAILAAQERRIGLAQDRQEQSLMEIVAHWLEKMNLVADFQAKRVAEHRREHEVLVRTVGSEHTVNLTDVGFGVSQVLPVVAQAFYAPHNSTIIFEQPEIHLHPSAQAALADLFIEAIHAKERMPGAGRTADRKTQLIVESHSEHFLVRLQRRIAEQVLGPDEVALYFCKPGPDGSILEALNLDEYGNITNWPENFFGDAFGDAAAMTHAEMRREGLGAVE